MEERKRQIGKVECHKCGHAWIGHPDALCPFCEIERLQSIVDKLPKCWRLNEEGQLLRDLPVLPDMVVYVWHFDYMDKVHTVKVHSVSTDAVTVACEYKNEPAPIGSYFPEDCYSTREAAGVAKGVCICHETVVGKSECPVHGPPAQSGRMGCR